MKGMKKKPGRWKPGESGNPRGRKPGTGDAAMLRAAIRESIPDIIKRLVEQAVAGDAQSARLLLERVLAPVKATAESIEVPGMANAKDLTGMARAALESIARGEIPPDVGATMVSAIGQTARVIEIDELERRIAALENGAEAKL